jgi:hypothetical protein
LVADGDFSPPVINSDLPVARNLPVAGSSMGGKGRSRSPKEAPDSLHSKQLASLVDLISEGPIAGLTSWGDIFCDGVPVTNIDGSFNFQNIYIQQLVGWPNQPIMTGFAAQQSETSVGTQLKYGVGQVRSVENADVDRIRVTVSVPSLQVINKKNGDISGTAVQFRVEVQYGRNGVWLNAGGYTISGKTSSRYQRAVMLVLSGAKPVDIRVTRLTPDSTVQEMQNDLYWDSYTEIIDDRINYNLSAVVGINIDSEQFSSIPKRTYLVYGRYMLLPDNYNAQTGVYTGVWSGNFQYNWSSNPAWVLFDLITNSRYGLGQFITVAQLDKWEFYRIGQWCDGLVPNGYGGYERRWTCNVQILSQQDAYDLVRQFAAIFRGFTYWDGGKLVPVADMPADPATQFTNADVIDGAFIYSGTDLRSRHTQINVGWNDPKLLGDKRFATVEDHASITKYGIQNLDMDALGCISESQAVRVGKWQLYTELYETELVQFSTGLDKTWTRPGDIIRISDVHVGGKRRGGRVASGTTASRVYFDAPVGAATAGGAIYVSCVLGEGKIETKQLVNLSPDQLFGDLVSPFSDAPALDTTFVVNEVGDLEPTLWRVTGISQGDLGTYDVKAVRHYPDKWAYVENNIALSVPDTSDIPIYFRVTSLTAMDYLVRASPISVGVKCTVSWVSEAPRFDIAYRNADRNDNWQVIRTAEKAVDLDVIEGNYEFQVTPISPIGLKGPMTTLKYKVIGRYAPPPKPEQFRVQSIGGVGHFEWKPSDTLDVIIGGHYELRHSSRTFGAIWGSARTVVATIPGTASTVEAPYQSGTWFLRTFDIVNVPSSEAAVIFTTTIDEQYAQFARICENPDFLGDHYGTEVKLPQEWLVLGQSGGRWDEQLNNIDTWPQVDVLPVVNPPLPTDIRTGYYIFDNMIDAGGVFPIRFSTDMLAFVYNETGEFIDDRQTESDTWPDWDNSGSDLSAEVQLSIRMTNDDPANPDAIWTEWETFGSAEYTARGFQFRADLWAQAGQNIGIEQLCILADLKNKVDEGGDVAYNATPLDVFFDIKFYTIPAIVVTVQNALSTDQVQITNKSRDRFTISITNAGAQVSRTFDWHAQGY